MTQGSILFCLECTRSIGFHSWSALNLAYLAGMSTTHLMLSMFFEVQLSRTFGMTLWWSKSSSTYEATNTCGFRQSGAKRFQDRSRAPLVKKSQGCGLDPFFVGALWRPFKNRLKAFQEPFRGLFKAFQWPSKFLQCFQILFKCRLYVF